ncbi:glycosyltransferase family 4 protein [Phenylobacterium montanum]|uniref:Glycosyltransferase family 4 protein n=1 Tax=Phenylobacterium montanum TaxID=2823693 RepID=A0A975G317_9CAUL|nr:glycosyltransferase family 1 protein [Caulobacter sp. S6]QUD89096.1 glycosyltransferase family 4 protein [Caulobacter sp. S6]
MLDQDFDSHDEVGQPLHGPRYASVPILGFGPRQRSAPEIILDLSRLISRVRFNAPTGVDRVEMAYAKQLLQFAPERLSFAAVHPTGVYGRLPTAAAAAFLHETEQTWIGGRHDRQSGVWSAKAVRALVRMLPRLAPEPIPERCSERVYLQVSPHHLDRPRRIRNILAREKARFVCLVHDLIPIEYPEHARPNGKSLHARRMETVSRFADAVIAASESTRRSLLGYLAHQGRGRDLDVCVAPLGADQIRARAPTQFGGSPYFVFVGTIEPRKNHLLLLNLWRRMVDELGPHVTPRLVLVGRRGWENENIVDMLDRCPQLVGVVEERGQLCDQEMWPIVAGARALVMPSFAEGFGLPVVEALKLGVPVLCSDIPAHREIADPIAEFFDPLDGPSWRAAISDYASPTSPRRQAQLSRMRLWKAPTWESHVRAAVEFIDGEPW